MRNIDKDIIYMYVIGKVIILITMGETLGSIPKQHTRVDLIHIFRQIIPLSGVTVH
jgi:hypothetical protein